MANSQPARLTLRPNRKPNSKTAISRLGSHWARAGLVLIIVMGLIAGCEENSSHIDQRAAPIALLGSELALFQQEHSKTALASIEYLSDTTQRFLQAPTALQQAQWQDAWEQAHQEFLIATILINVKSPQYRLVDSWPIFPGFIDSLPEYPTSGIVNDETLEITIDMLRAQHQVTDDEETTLGFHPLGYYVFTRSLDDFFETAPNVERRKLLVELVAGALVEDASQLFAADDGLVSTELPRTYADLLRRLHERSQLIFSEYNRLGEHSPHGVASTVNVAIQLHTLQQLLEGPVDLKRFLIELDKQKTKVLLSTLTESAELIKDSQNLDESAQARLVLLVAAISHQLDDFIRLLPRESEI
jgi:hypothetical protein